MDIWESGDPGIWGSGIWDLEVWGSPFFKIVIFLKFVKSILIKILKDYLKNEWSFFKSVLVYQAGCTYVFLKFVHRY